MTYSEFSRQELSVGICMGTIGEGGGFEIGNIGGSNFLDPPSRNFLGHLYEILIISAQFLAQAQSIGTLF